MPVPSFRYATSEKIYWNYRHFSATGMINYGEWSVGKSKVSIDILKELYPKRDEWRKYLVFKPEQFLDLVDGLSEANERVPCIVWDDAGLWLYALDWNDPKVKSVVKFLNVLRTVTAGLIMTTPAVDMIVTKIPHIEGMRIGKTTFRSGGKWEDRVMSVYRNTFMPWGKRYVKMDWEDPFKIMMPDEDYAYYKPLRDGYAREAIQMMREAWHYQRSKDNIVEKEARISEIEAKIGFVQQ